MRTRISSLSILLLLFLVGCNLPGSSNVSADAIYTEAAKTLSAQATLQAASTVIAQLTELAGGGSQSSTPQPLPASATVPAGTAAPSATSTPPPTFTPSPLPPTATPDPRRCNQAAFIRDVSVPDDTYFPPNAEFIKVWRLQNVGYCTWDSSYSLVFANGDRMEGDKQSSLPGIVRPGEVVDVSVVMIAPLLKGRYRGNWMLSNGTGERFGLGDDAIRPFYSQIRVLAPNPNVIYDFAVNLCAAEWRSSAGKLTCPSAAPSNDGSIILLDHPKLESGRTEDEYTLWTRPQAVGSGWIKGTYPAYKVKANDHFMAQIGCLADNKGCAVTFTLDYMLPNGRTKDLGEWFEAYEGGTTIIDINLSGLEGQTIQLILGVIVEDRPDKANVFWLAPSIRRVVPPTPTPTLAPPTPTPTPTATAVPYPDPAKAVEAARQVIASAFSLPPDQLLLFSIVQVVWQDTCLGIPNSTQICQPAVIPGYQMIFRYKDLRVEAHTNLDGSQVFWFDF